MLQVEFNKKKIAAKHLVDAGFKWLNKKWYSRQCKG